MESIEEEMKNYTNLGQKLKRKHKELMNKRGRVTPNQVMPNTFRLGPLYRLHKLGEITLKDPTWNSFERKTLR